MKMSKHRKHGGGTIQAKRSGENGISTALENNEISAMRKKISRRKPMLAGGRHGLGVDNAHGLGSGRIGDVDGAVPPRCKTCASTVVVDLRRRFYRLRGCLGRCGWFQVWRRGAAGVCARIRPHQRIVSSRAAFALCACPASALLHRSFTALTYALLAAPAPFCAHAAELVTLTISHASARRAPLHLGHHHRRARIAAAAAPHLFSLGYASSRARSRRHQSVPSRGSSPATCFPRGLRSVLRCISRIKKQKNRRGSCRHQ